MGLASSTMVQTDKSLGITPLHKQILGDGTRPQRVRIETGDASVRVDELHVAAPDRLLEVNCRTTQASKFRGDENFIIEHGGAEEVDRNADDRELQCRSALQPWLVDAQGPQPLGPAALQNFR